MPAGDGAVKSAQGGFDSAAPPGGVVFEIEGVSHTFRSPDGRTMEVLKDVTLAVGANEFFTVVGPSGCGKSTLLNIAAGLIIPARGKVRHVGPATKPAVGYITQDSNLLPWATVLENVMVPLEIAKVPKQQRRRRAEEWIEVVGLAGFENHYPRQLSGGMQKRCSIARTLVYDPDIVFMDEPFGALDAITRTTLQQVLVELWQTRRKTIVFITHDLTEAIALSDRVAVMTGRPGTIKASLPVPIDRPRDIARISTASGYQELHDRLWSLLEADLGRR